jgi:hypothetical protein
MPYYSVIDARTGAEVAGRETYSEASKVARTDLQNLQVIFRYRPGELRF